MYMKPGMMVMMNRMQWEKSCDHFERHLQRISQHTGGSIFQPHFISLASVFLHRVSEESRSEKRKKEKLHDK